MGRKRLKPAKPLIVFNKNDLVSMVSNHAWSHNTALQQSYYGKVKLSEIREKMRVYGFVEAVDTASKKVLINFITDELFQQGEDISKWRDYSKVKLETQLPEVENGYPWKKRLEKIKEVIAGENESDNGEDVQSIENDGGSSSNEEEFDEDDEEFDEDDY